MTQNTSLPNYNQLWLQGHGVDDEMFISDWNENKLSPGPLDPKLAHTKDLMPTVIRMGIQDDLGKGVIDEAEAKSREVRHMKNYRELLAENGMLK